MPRARQVDARPGAAVQTLHCLRASNATDLSSPPHRHDFHQFLYLLAGHAEVTLDGLAYHVPPHHLLTIAPGRMHALAFPVEAVERCEAFQLKCRINPAAGLPEPPELADCTALARECALAVELIERVLRPGPAGAADAAAAGALACLLALAARSAGGGARTLDPRLRAATEHILANLDAPISVAHLAGLCRLDPSYFCRLFGAGLGMPPRQWIAERRLERACALLVFSQATTAEVAEAVGFRSCHHFSGLFLRRYGMRPGAYRTAQRGQAPG
ncbi:MAG: AraC family transcriptional regulator [Planctomycetes bacterium]|nr:AraC family transcriptional regulator [Planctomycetota bacterium]